MADYDLDGLGAARFEKLCQALALGEFGSSVEIYGAGPDGGRDATVQDLMSFPSTTAPWSGYTVVQMKFREHPRKNSDDVRWLIAELRKELQKWADPDARRVLEGRLPEQFILATNVALSPAVGNGGIDTVNAAMRELVATYDLPLRDWQVWHRDKIYALLDNNANVRRAHLDGVLAGDVLARLDERLSRHGSVPGRTGTGGLPREARDLFGRDSEVLAAGKVLQDDDGAGRRAVVVTGPPGIGKSAVALRISRQAADRFPDGQFHVDLALMGDGEGADDLTRALLSAVHPDSESLAGDHVQQTAALREVLSTSRVLILIDGIVSEAALLDVLRMDGPFALVCTSQARLGGLTGSVHAIELGGLPSRYGEELVRSVAGDGRLTDVQVSGLVEACGGHPLALQVAASYLASRPKADADRYLREITISERGVRALRSGQTALQPVLERALAALPPEHEQMFLQLGVLPHMSITTDVAAAGWIPPGELTHRGIDDAAEVLDWLFELSLIEQIADDRYVLHSILHRFARLKSAALEHDRQEAIVRRTCVMLAARAHQLTQAIGFVDEQATIPADSNATALRELGADRAGMLAMVQQASEYGLWEDVARLVSNATPYLWNAGGLADLEVVYRRVLEAGEQSDNSEWKAAALHNLGNFAAHRGESATAEELYRRCADVARSAVDPYFMYLAHTSTGTLFANLGRPYEAIAILRQDLSFWRITKNDSMLATVLGNVGQCYLGLGKIRRAKEYLDNSARLSRKAAQVGTRGSSALLMRVGPKAEAAGAVAQDLQRARAVGNALREAEALTRLSDLAPAGRPTADSGRPLEQALKIYRDAGDVQGQVDVLMRLGHLASALGDPRAAIEYFTESASLAHEIGNEQSAALTLARLVKYAGGAGHHDEAERYLVQAERMARRTGNPAVVADVQQVSAEYLGHLGQNARAVTLLTEALGHVSTGDDGRAINSLKVSLAAALVEAGRWNEGEELLSAVIGASRETASETTRIGALRARGILYSRRGLHVEAASILGDALGEAEQSGDAHDVFHCRAALGGAHARNGNWADALDAYSAAAECAAELGDVHALVTTRGMVAVCVLKTGADEQPALEATRILKVANELKMRPVELSLHNALGFHHAQNDEHDRAIAAFKESAVLAGELGDQNGLAAASSNLARSYASMTEHSEAIRHAREGFWRHHDLGNWESAARVLLLLNGVHHDRAPGLGDLSAADLVGTERSIDRRVGIAADALTPSGSRALVANDEPSSSQASIGRKVNLSADVHDALDGIEVGAMIARLAESQQRCAVCGLLIDEYGEGELILLRDVRSSDLIVRLAHPSCATSHVVQVDDVDGERFIWWAEAECAFFDRDGREVAAVIVDAHNGWGSLDGGPVEDLLLRILRESGFTNLRPADEDGEEPDGALFLSDLPTFDQNDVWAELTDNELVISNSAGDLLPSTPLSFTSDWYQTAASGPVMVIVGRNLQGMVQEDSTYLRRAIRAGNVVGGVTPLNVVRPRRNGPCPCEMRQGRKFKHCCEKRTTAASGGNPSSAQRVNKR